MTSGVVVEASVVVKWLVTEQGTEIAVRLLDGRSLHAPQMMFVEVANVLWVMRRRGTLSYSEALDAQDVLHNVPLSAAPPDKDMVREAHRLAQLLDHPVYDCLYLALALSTGCPVVTADRKFVFAAAKDPDTSRLVQLLDTYDRAAH